MSSIALTGAALTLPLLLSGCGGGTPGDRNNRGPFELLLITTGLGQVYPYRITELDAFQNPSTKVINITTLDDLRQNTSAVNGVLPVSTYSDTATLPGGNPGNHFLLMRFSHELGAESILSDLPANQSNSGLTGSIQVLEYDPVTEIQRFIRGRGFVGGYTYYDDPSTPTLDLKLVQAVRADKDGNVTVVDSRATGFPLGFSGDEDLVAKNSFVFVPDTDDNLATYEMMPADKVYRFIVTSSVLDYRDKPLVQEACVATVRGTDNVAPQVIGYSTGNVQISPGNGQLGVDPTTTIQVNFSKPVQPRDVGELYSKANLTPPLRGVSINVTVAANTVPITYYGDPRTPGDFCTFIVKPAYYFPGSVPVSFGVNTTVNSLTGVGVGSAVTTTFTTGRGPGFVNVPVAPYAVYVGRGGSGAGVSVIDLDGFGQGTGDITKAQDPNYQFGYKRNPNIGQPGIYPSLAPGTTNMDAGSLGALTLCVDTNLNDRLLDETVLASVGDIHLGQPLDKVFNNENINPQTSRALQMNPLTGVTLNAWGNSITAPPTPNPPRLLFPPLNPAMGIFGEPPTLTSIAPSPPCPLSPPNNLVKGNPFATIQGAIGLFHTSFPGQFYGPQARPGSPQPPTLPCPYYSRQQVGHFLYVLDRDKKQIVVLNSNRFTVLETIKLSDPVAMAVSPNLRRLAVANFGSGTVSFIDVDPGSESFHQVVGETRVGRGPIALAWQPEGEDLLVANNLGNSVSILRGTDGTLRKTAGGLLRNPIDVVCTMRQTGVGFQAGIYFAYVLNIDGTVAIFESGPDGTNGIGFDDVIGIPGEAKFRNSRAIQNDVTSFNSAIWVVHQDDSNLGQISHLELTSSQAGPIPISPNQGGFILPPTFRQREWTVNARIGGASPTTPIKDRLSGDAPVDIVFDEMNNAGALADLRSTQVANLIYADHSGKGQGKLAQGGILAAITPRFMFVALADSGKVDVVELDTGKIVRSIPVPGVRVLATYWKQ